MFAVLLLVGWLAAAVQPEQQALGFRRDRDDDGNETGFGR